MRQTCRYPYCRPCAINTPECDGSRRVTLDDLMERADDIISQGDGEIEWQRWARQWRRDYKKWKSAVST